MFTWQAQREKDRQTDRQREREREICLGCVMGDPYFREMPWGEMYIKPYTGRVLTRAAFTLGTRVAAFKAAAEKMGAQPVGHGDAGYEFQLVPGYRMQILVWEGDDEFPPNAQVLYSDNFAEGFAAEDRVVAGDILISTIKFNM